MSVLHVSRVHLLLVHTNTGEGIAGDPVRRVLTLLDPATGRHFQLREGGADFPEPLKSLVTLILNAEETTP